MDPSPRLSPRADLTDLMAPFVTRLTAPVTRRALLRGVALAGAAVVVTPALVSLNGCSSSDTVNPDATATINLSTELGALNFAYALTQLEQDFYQRVVPNLYPGMLASEAQTFNNFTYTLAAQSTTMQTTITTHRIGDALTFRFFELVNFADRSDVIANARTISETALRGYVGVQQLLTTSAYTDIMNSAITSATDRATQVRAMAGVFDPVDATPLDATAVLAVLRPYYQTTLTVRSA